MVKDFLEHGGRFAALHAWVWARILGAHLTYLLHGHLQVGARTIPPSVLDMLGDVFRGRPQASAHPEPYLKTRCHTSGTKPVEPHVWMLTSLS